MDDEQQPFYIIIMILSFCLYLYQPQAQANQAKYEDVNNIKEKTTQYLQKLYNNPDDLTLKVGHIDSRLKLKSCINSIQTEAIQFNENKSKQLVKVSCPEPTWQVYLTVDAVVMVPAVIANNTLGKNQIISKDDISIKKISKNNVNGVIFNDVNNVIGKKTTQNIASGSLIKAKYVGLKQVVAKGQGVQIYAEKGNIQIISHGKALSDGHQGQWIKVENIRSKKIIDALVISPGQVRVAL